MMKYIFTALLLSAYSFSAHADLLGLYTFEGDAMDSSGQGNHGANINNLTYSASGYEGMAGQFGGNTFFDAPIDLNPSAVPRTTFGAWVNASVLNSPVRHEILSTDNGAFDRALTIDSRGDTGIESGIGTYSAFSGNGALLNGSTASTADGWVFVAAVYNQLANATRLYVGDQAYTEPGRITPSQTFTRIGAPPNGTEGFNGLIDNAFVFDRALSVGEIDRIRQNGAAEILSLAIDPVTVNRLWSVDIHAVGGSPNAEPNPPTMTGAESFYGDGAVWNAFEVAGHSGTSLNPTLTGLVDSTGASCTVNFTISGTLSGWSNAAADPLKGDYVFVAAGGSDASANWQISGLNPGNNYELMLYAGVGRAAPITVDVNGNGILGDDTTVTVGANDGLLIENIVADANGLIIGNFLSNNGGEANWSGFQLRDITVIPEPGSASLLLLGLLTLGACVRRTN